MAPHGEDTHGGPFTGPEDPCDSYTSYARPLSPSETKAQVTGEARAVALA